MNKSSLNKSYRTRSNINAFGNFGFSQFYNNIFNFSLNNNKKNNIFSFILNNNLVNLDNLQIS